MSANCEKYREMTDDEFINSILRGDEEAEGCFREIYVDRPVRFIVFKKYYWLKSDVEDICQELWLYFKARDWRVLTNFKNLPKQPDSPMLRSYLYGAISRLIVKWHMNNFGRFLIPLIFDEGGESLEISTPGPEGIFEREELHRRAETLVGLLFDEALTPESPAGLNITEQKILRMRCVMQPPLSSKEVGDLLNMKFGAVDTALSRAKRKIRDFYEAKGLLKDVKEVLRDVATS